MAFTSNESQNLSLARVSVPETVAWHSKFVVHSSSESEITVIAVKMLKSHLYVTGYDVVAVYFHFLHQGRPQFSASDIMKGWGKFQTAFCENKRGC